MSSAVGVLLWILGVMVSFIPLALAIYRFLRLSEQNARRQYVINAMYENQVEPKYSKLNISQSKIITLPVRKAYFKATKFENGKRVDVVLKNNED